MMYIYMPPGRKPTRVGRTTWMLDATQLHIHVSCYAIVCARTVRIMHACGSLRSVLALRHTSGQDVTQEKPASKISTPL